MKRKTVYIVERRSNREKYPTIEDAPAFIGSTIKKCADWIKKNKDFDTDHSYYWWWTVYSHPVDSENNIAKLLKHYDWDGKELKEQPAGMELQFTHDMTKVKINETIFHNFGIQYKIDEIKKQNNLGKTKQYHLWSKGRCICKVKAPDKETKHFPYFARLVPVSELTHKK